MLYIGFNSVYSRPLTVPIRNRKLSVCEGASTNGVTHSNLFSALTSSRGKFKPDVIQLLFGVPSGRDKRMFARAESQMSRVNFDSNSEQLFYLRAFHDSKDTET